MPATSLEAQAGVWCPEPLGTSPQVMGIELRLCRDAMGPPACGTLQLQDPQRRVSFAERGVGQRGMSAALRLSGDDQAFTLVWFLVVLEVELGLCLLGTCSATEPHPQPRGLSFGLSL